MNLFSDAFRWLKIPGARNKPRPPNTQSTTQPAKKNLNFSFHPIPRQLQTDIPEHEVHEISEEDKARLLENYRSRYAHEKEKGQKLLSKLGEITPTLTSAFDLNVDPVAAFIFRLINRNLKPEASNAHDSFIALSYCWPEKQREQFSHTTGAQHSQNHRLPMGAAMYEALQQQTTSAREGIWIDQICIDQSNPVEKATSINAMIALYRCARLVVAALCDVHINAESEKWLAKHGGSLSTKINESFPDEEVQNNAKDPMFRQLARTLFSSRWFTRAWCTHEMRLARKFVFIVPCGNEKSRRYLQFTSEFLRDIHRLFTASMVDIVANPTDTTTIRDRSLAERVAPVTFSSLKTGLVVTRPTNGQPVALHDYESFSSDTSYTTHAREIFDLGAGGDPTLREHLRRLDANFDKASIVLNTVGDGLVLRRPKTYTGHEDQFSEVNLMAVFMLLALASGDPIALCSTGPPISLPNGERTWLNAPSTWDSKHKKSQPLRLMPLEDVKISAMDPYSSICLYCISLGAPKQPNPEAMSLAKDFIDKLLERGPSEAVDHIIDYRIPWREQIKAGGEFAYNRYVQTVACIIQCDLRWLISTSSKVGHTTTHRLDSEIIGNFRHEDLGTVKLQYFSMIKWETSYEDRRLLELILEFANWMITVGCGTWREGQEQKEMKSSSAMCAVRRILRMTLEGNILYMVQNP
ncbi:hypothetical protein EJ08DRAFT_664160 [Tothia fuscella]|uniref:Heterokaryon incompatibility domain-containing protein n=1 Tax=Tothia fuscella TaxID=1048955 RepID=A0A9P4NJ29_9PEZI|nr:hypothetical protein EJ08DRAFT_664160 [Tothia fuscella]